MPVTSRKTILVADDDPAVLAVVASILAQAGFHVLEAPDGPAALELAGQTREDIHLLLSDVDMPGMRGPELAKALQEQRTETRVALMSGGGDAFDIPAMNYGWAYIEKPFASTTLVSMVNGVLHGRERSRSAGASPEASAIVDTDD
jgi:two-component system cell cycle sensor histidine kinase/response regulator CckA